MSEFNRERAEQLIKEAKARDYSKHEIELAELLEETLGFDMERRAYYDNYKLVKTDWNTLRAVLTRLTNVLKEFRQSDHSYDRAPTPEGQAVLDTYDEVVKTLANRDVEIRNWRTVTTTDDEVQKRFLFLESEVRKYDDAHNEDLKRIEGLRSKFQQAEEKMGLILKQLSTVQDERDTLRRFLDAEKDQNTRMGARNVEAMNILGGSYPDGVVERAQAVMARLAAMTAARDELVTIALYFNSFVPKFPAVGGPTVTETRIAELSNVGAVDNQGTAGEKSK